MEMYMEEILTSLMPSMVINLLSSVLGIVSYVLTALALYTIAKRRGLNNPWMAWIPVANLWLLGSISDQYRYVARGEVKSKRKVLLVLDILLILVLIGFFATFVAFIVQAVIQSMSHSYGTNEEMIRPLIAMLALLLPMAGLSIAMSVVQYMALYDVYASCDPNNKVLYLVLSIFISLAQPIILMILRDKDAGMPPRRPAPFYAIPNQTWQDQ